MAAEVDPHFPYGLDRPKQARGTAGIGMLAGVLTLVSALLPNAFESGLVVLVLFLLLVCIGSFVISAGLFRTASSSKVKAVDRLLNGLDLRGDEDALDLGCGTGLLCAGLAVRLPDGDVTGVDAWVESQLTPNGKAVAKRTLSLAGVKGVTLRTGSIRELPVQDAGFDVIVSRDALAMLPSGAARREAAAEIARALRPGGRVALLEPFGTRAVVEELRARGLTDATRSRRRWSTMPPLRTITATKPAAGA
ncbi:class I SAM-dependent methyltransferase [Patulibacter minatonensis]|uniref:class I SAM-dependent methyltransferase n=1 Tax=Patulibacter minatonensis TaxID=298163 RepID=UPI0004B371EA|nr:class I SAM-dependent methyltransferase [Patulibacter minatonensis]